MPILMILTINKELKKYKYDLLTSSVNATDFLSVSETNLLSIAVACPECKLLRGIGPGLVGDSELPGLLRDDDLLLYLK